MFICGAAGCAAEASRVADGRVPAPSSPRRRSTGGRRTVDEVLSWASRWVSPSFFSWVRSMLGCIRYHVEASVLGSHGSGGKWEAGTAVHRGASGCLLPISKRSPRSVRRRWGGGRSAPPPRTGDGRDRTRHGQPPRASTPTPRAGFYSPPHAYSFSGACRDPRRLPPPSGAVPGVTP